MWMGVNEKRAKGQKGKRDKLRLKYGLEPESPSWACTLSRFHDRVVKGGTLRSMVFSLLAARNSFRGKV
jgi:hypothetical protein